MQRLAMAPISRENFTVTLSAAYQGGADGFVGSISAVTMTNQSETNPRSMSTCAPVAMCSAVRSESASMAGTGR